MRGDKVYTINTMGTVSNTNLNNDSVLQPNLQTLIGQNSIANTLAGNLQTAGGVATPILQSAPPSDAVNYHPQTYASMQPSTVTNNVPVISEGYDKVLSSTVQAIKAALAQAKQGYQKTISETPQQYDKLRNATYGQTLSAVPVLRENLANIGTSQQSGYSKTQELRLNTDLQNRLNELNMEQQKVINDANFEIQNLEAQGLTQEAQAASEIAQQKLQAIIQEQNRIDEVSRGQEQFEYQKLRDTIGDTQWQQQFGAQEEQRAFENAMTGDQFAFQQEQAKLQNQLAQGTFDMQKQQMAWEQAYQTGVFDYQKARDLVSDSRYSAEWQQALDEWAYQKEQDRISNQLAQGQFDLATEAQNWEQKYNEGMFNYQKERDLVGDSRYSNEWQQRLNEFAYQKEQDRIDNEIKQGSFNMQLEQQLWDQKLQQGMFDYEKERDAVTDARYTDEWKLTLDKFEVDKAQQKWDNDYQTGLFDYEKERDLLAESKYEKEWTQKLDEWLYEKQMTDRQMGQQDKQIELAAAQQKWENDFKTGTFNFEKAQTDISNSQWAQEMAQNLAEFSANKGIAERETALKEAESNIEQMQAKTLPYTSYINSVFVTPTYDSTGQVETGISYDTDGIISYLESLQASGVDEQVLRNVASIYGIAIAGDEEQDYRNYRLKNKI